jgi:hypothetical protein
MTERPALRMVGGGAEDSVVRRQRFEQAHPEAVVEGRTLGAWDLGGLMDQFDAIYPTGGSVG